MLDAAGCHPGCHGIRRALALHTCLATCAALWTVCPSVTCDDQTQARGNAQRPNRRADSAQSSRTPATAQCTYMHVRNTASHGVPKHTGRQNNPSFHNRPGTCSCSARLRAALPRPPTTALPHQRLGSASRAPMLQCGCCLPSAAPDLPKDPTEFPNPGITSFFNLPAVSSCSHPAGSHPAQTSNCVPEPLCFCTTPPLLPPPSPILPPCRFTRAKVSPRVNKSPRPAAQSSLVS